MTNLAIRCDKDESLNISGLSEAIKKMPALTYVAVGGLSEEQTLELTCSIIDSQVNNKDIIVNSFEGCSHYDAVRIRKNGNSEPCAETLRLVIEPRGKDYGDKVRQFVQRLSGCSIIVNESNVTRGWCYTIGFYGSCLCNTEGSSDDSSDEDF